MVEHGLSACKVYPTFEPPFGPKASNTVITIQVLNPTSYFDEHGLT